MWSQIDNKPICPREPLALGEILMPCGFGMGNNSGSGTEGEIPRVEPRKDHAIGPACSSTRCCCSWNAHGRRPELCFRSGSSATIKTFINFRIF